jgi:hypothetical protein
MKTIRLLAFRGVGFRNPQYTDEDALIKAGHVGFQLEGDPTIYGFHPTEEAIKEIGGEAAALKWLREHQTLDGRLFDDSPIFQRARSLAEQGGRTTVYQLDYQFDEEEFDIIKAKVISWIENEQVSPYRWPEPSLEPMPEEADNCGTVPRRFGIPIPEPTGSMRLYTEAMRSQYGATIWGEQE